ncbi:MAG: hypothetical protein WCK89_02360 [bacterium]
MIRPLIVASICAYSLASWGSDDEVRFKPKTYAPRQTLRDSTYNESAYAPDDTPRSLGRRVDSPSTPSRWRLFNREKKLSAPAKLADAPVEHEAPYKQEKQISVPTLKADPRDVPDKKPFQESDSKLTDADFEAKKASREKNPLLAPRQGIKAPE